MASENELLKKRFIELSRRSHSNGVYCFTDFLGLSEQSLFVEARRDFAAVSVTLFGGVPGAERVMARFGSEEELGWHEDFPIVCIKAEPVSQKFADKLTHRDFLGALLNLGISRSTLGDIPISDNVGYIFAKRDIADFIISELKRVKHTDMKLSILEALPDFPLYKTEIKRVQANGERIDALIAKAYSLSREEASLLFSRGSVFVNGRLSASASYIPKINEIISVRGRGRMRYLGYETTTKKGKLNINLELYV